VLLLVSGASCAGKSTVRRLVVPRLEPAVDGVELTDLAPYPAVVDVAWRQRTTELALRRARDGDRHVLLAGDPVAAGEALAAPSAADVDVAVCVLDVGEAEQRRRLTERGDPVELHDDHVAFARWMRDHATDPTRVPEALWAFGSDPDMVWERWTGLEDGDPRWQVPIVDGERSSEQVADDVEAWARAAIAGEAPVFRAGWWRQDNA
jgi:hypothetical protein